MADNGTVGRVQTMMCPKPAPEVPPGTPEMRAWDGVQSGSPAEEYLKSARGGLDPVRADSFHYQQALSLQDGIIGEVIGAGLGYVLKLGAKLLGAAKGVATAACCAEGGWGHWGSGAKEFTSAQTRAYRQR